MVVEGVRTAKAVHGWAKKLDIDMPITESIYAILFENKDAREAVDLLMGREKRSKKNHFNRKSQNGLSAYFGSFL